MSKANDDNWFSLFFSFTNEQNLIHEKLPFHFRSAHDAKAFMANSWQFMFLKK